MTSLQWTSTPVDRHLHVNGPLFASRARALLYFVTMRATETTTAAHHHNLNKIIFPLGQPGASFSSYYAVVVVLKRDLVLWICSLIVGIRVNAIRACRFSFVESDVGRENQFLFDVVFLLMG